MTANNPSTAFFEIGFINDDVARVPAINVTPYNKKEAIASLAMQFLETPIMDTPEGMFFTDKVLWIDVVFMDPQLVKPIKLAPVIPITHRLGQSELDFSNKQLELF